MPAAGVLFPAAALAAVSASSAGLPRGGNGFKIAPVVCVASPQSRSVRKTPPPPPVAEENSKQLLKLKKHEKKQLLKLKKHAFDEVFLRDSSPRPTPALNSDNAAALLGPIYLDMMDKMSICSPPNAAEDDSEVERIVSKLALLCAPEMARKHMAAGAAYAHYVCKLHPLEVRVKIAHYTALFFSADDYVGKAEEGAARARVLEDLRLFPTKLLDPQGGRGRELHHALEGFLAYHRSPELHPFGRHPELVSVMVRCTLTLLEACLLEQHYEAHPLAFTPDMLLFPRFLRSKSGMSEVFALFVLLQPSSVAGTDAGEEEVRFFHKRIMPMVPDVMETIDIMNDILSFYKEVLDGETTIYLLTHATVSNMTSLECLRDRVDFVVAARNRVMALAHKAGWEDKLGQYFQGFVWFHLLSKRYRLTEVLGDTGFLLCKV